jgi:hypothetical protein
MSASALQRAPYLHFQGFQKAVKALEVPKLDFLAAAQLLKGIATKTPLQHCRSLSQKYNAGESFYP